MRIVAASGIAAGLCLLAWPAGHARAQEPLAGLGAYIETSMAAWGVPGLAIAVVKDDSVVLAEGYGVREVGGSDRVDAGTVFAIGSITKSLTAALLGILAAEGRVELDDAAAEHLPGFRLADAYLTREVTLRDLAAHRTGVAGGDLLWASGGLDRAEIVRRAGLIEPRWSLRSRFDYSNVMFIALGEALAAAGGASWDELVRSRILDPLGMARTTTSVVPLERMSNVATPHDPSGDGGAVPVPWRNMDHTAAAGGINSSVAEMARWLRVMLSEGRLGAVEVLSPELVREALTPQAVIRREGPWALMSPDAHFMTYGLGWFLQDYRGRLVAQHGGGIDGMSAMAGLVPEEGLGVVVLSNLNGNQLPLALLYRVIDAYVGAPATDWSQRLLESTRRLYAAAESAQREREAGLVEGTTPTLPLEAYAGTYVDAVHGETEVWLDGGQLRMRYGTAFVGRLEHVQYDLFRAVWENPARGTNYVSFTIDVERRPAELDLYLWVTANFKRAPRGDASRP